MNTTKKGVIKMEEKRFWWIAGKRAYELGEEGLTSKQQAEIVNQEYPDRPCAAATLRGYKRQYVNWLKEKDQAGGRDVTPISKPKRAPVKPEPVRPGMPGEDLERRMRAIAMEAAREVITELLERSPVFIDRSDMPPPPVPVDDFPGRGKETRQYHKFTATVDNNLWKLLQKDMIKHDLATGRMLDVILWRHYDRPPLSYEEGPVNQDQSSNHGDEPESP